VVQGAPWQPIFEAPNSHNVVCFDAAFQITRLSGTPLFHSAKMPMALSTSPAKKIPQKRVRVAFAKKEEWFSRKCFQLVGQDVQSSF